MTPSVQVADAALPVCAGQGSHTPENPWSDSVIGGTEEHLPCLHCLMGPCVTVRPITKLEGSCDADIRNHSKRHKDYQKFLKDEGLWQHEIYINRKTSAGLSEVELRELTLVESEFHCLKITL